MPKIDKECDFDLPHASVVRIVKNATKASVQLSRECKTSLSRCGGIFILYLTSVAHDFCRERKRQTLMPQDVYDALRETDFDDFIPLLKRFLDKKKKASLKKDSGVNETNETEMNKNEDNEEEEVMEENEVEDEEDADLKESVATENDEIKDDEVSEKNVDDTVPAEVEEETIPTEDNIENISKIDEGKDIEKKVEPLVPNLQPQETTASSSNTENNNMNPMKRSIDEVTPSNSQPDVKVAKIEEQKPIENN